LILASPHLSHVSLDLCLAMVFSMAAIPRIMHLSFFNRLLSPSDRFLNSYAFSSCAMTSLATAIATLV
jgi:hypothetical protein